MCTYLLHPQRIGAIEQTASRHGRTIGRSHRIYAVILAMRVYTREYQCRRRSVRAGQKSDNPQIPGNEV